MKTYKHQCTETIWGERVNSWRCQKEGVVERDNKWYCKIHDPEYRKVKRAVEAAKFDAKYIEHQKSYRRGEAMRTACAPFTTEELEAGIIQDIFNKVRGEKSC